MERARVDPPDLDGGIEAQRRAIEMATDVDAAEVATWAKVRLAHALSTGGYDGASEAVCSTLASSFDAGHAMSVCRRWRCAVVTWASVGDTEGAVIDRRRAVEYALERLDLGE